MTMTNERVTHLSLMSIEYDILHETYFDDRITDFAQRKGEKVLALWKFDKIQRKVYEFEIIKNLFLHSTPKISFRPSIFLCFDLQASYFRE